MTVAIDPALFRETLGHYPTGVAAVTAVADDGAPAGMVVGTFSSVSLDPPLIAFYPTASSYSFDRVRSAPAFCVNVLASDQESLCRQLATGGVNKFDGVQWRPGPLGAPVLAGAVSWVECTFEDVRPAGDHLVVLGRVQSLAVERSTLPLLFFQGGYGRFAPGSFVATPDPELIAAAQLAERIRPAVEELSDELAVNCSVVARIGWDAVQVLAANRSPVAESFPLGHRQPLIPPFGAVFFADAPPQEVDDWLGRGADTGLGPSHLQRVRDRGYSLLLAEPGHAPPPPAGAGRLRGLGPATPARTRHPGRHVRAGRSIRPGPAPDATSRPGQHRRPGPDRPWADTVGTAADRAAPGRVNRAHRGLDRPAHPGRGPRRRNRTPENPTDHDQGALT